MQKIDINSFIQHQKLPTNYVQLAEQYFFPMAKQIVEQQQKTNKPLILGINGAQGSGKSTLAELLVFLFKQDYQVNSVAISIDDFYFTRQQRIELAENIHPLLATRGVPGTHDVLLAQQTLDSLIQGKKPVSIPRFNKADDDRYAQEQWDVLEHPVDIIVFEGWCLGAEAQKVDDLKQPVNALEKNYDTGLVWRNYVNQQLQYEYATLFNKVDLWIMLKAPNFDCIFNWRLQQENKLRASIKDNNKTMDADEVKQFIQYYQRITEYLLKTLPNKVDYLFELDEQRNIIHKA